MILAWASPFKQIETQSWSRAIVKTPPLQPVWVTVWGKDYDISPTHLDNEVEEKFQLFCLQQLFTISIWYCSDQNT